MYTCAKKSVFSLLHDSDGQNCRVGSGRKMRRFRIRSVHLDLHLSRAIGWTGIDARILETKTHFHHGRSALDLR